MHACGWHGGDSTPNSCVGQDVSQVTLRQRYMHQYRVAVNASMTAGQQVMPRVENIQHQHWNMVMNFQGSWPLTSVHVRLPLTAAATRVQGCDPRTD